MRGFIRIRTLTVAALSLGLVLMFTSCSDDDTPAKDSAVPDTTQPDLGTPDAPVTDTGEPDGPAVQGKKLIILHTNDLHDHLMGMPNADYKPASTGDGTLGGFARLAARIKAERAAAGTDPVLLLDSGDFLMGTLFGWLAITDAPIMMLMQEMGYDATTLGNHEFEWGSKALAGFIGAAVKGGYKVPIVASNTVFDATDAGDDELEALQKSGAIVTKVVKTLDNGLKVGIFGLMGDSAATLAAAGKPVTWSKLADAAKPIIKELREQDKVDVVVCLSHSGTDETGKGEDADLAKDAPGIDVIISGHTHKELAKPVKVGDTLIVQTGKNTKKLGRLTLTVPDGGGKPVQTDYKLLALDDTVKGDAAIQTKIDDHIKKIDAVLAPAKLAYNAVVAETAFDLSFPYFSETPLGNVVTDAFVTVHNKLNPTEPADCAMEAGGYIRDAIEKGKTGQLWLADVYRAVPLGVGPDKKPGTSLVTAYFNGKDIKAAAELVPLAEGPLLNSQVYYLQVSKEVQIEYIMGGLPSISVKKVTIGGQDVKFTDTTKCYKVVINLFVAEMLSLVSSATSGLLKIEPKEKDCTTLITDWTTRIVDADPTTTTIEELKAWQAVVQYLAAFPDTDGDKIPDVPQSYAKTQNRIVGK
jgi:5'-nucleotidase